MNPDKPSSSTSLTSRHLKPAPKRFKRTEPSVEERGKLLLAGDFAPKFPDGGILFGQRCQVFGNDHDETDGGMVRIVSDESKEKIAEENEKEMEEKWRVYVDVANLLKGEVHLPGIFYPSQLVHFL